MDDCDLEKLIVKPAKLKPKFNRNVVEYEVVLNSGVKQLNIDPFTRDCNASWTIPGKGTERCIPIVEGTTFYLVIEVTAENGTTKNYTIAVTSLSASSTYISTLNIKGHTLNPPFKVNVYEYECNVPPDSQFVEFNVISPDKNTKIAIPIVDGDKAKLNLGKTNADVIVTSPDGTKSMTYTVTIFRDRLLVPVESSINKCSICFGVPHRPVAMATKDADKSIFCESCVQTITRVNKRHPLTNRLIDDKLYEWKSDIEVEVSSLTIPCILKCGQGVSIIECADHLKTKCEKKLSTDEKTGMISMNGSEIIQIACPSCSRSFLKNEENFHDSVICSSKHTITFKHQIDKSCKWQKKFYQEVVEQQTDNIMASASEAVKEFNTLIKTGNKSALPKDSLKHLETACQLYAYEIHKNQRNHEAHYKLGVMLELFNFVDDIFGLNSKKQELTNQDLDNGEFQTDESMEDDIKALAEMRGYTRNATTTQQLQALDQEYHQLLDQGQSEKADYVQKLYAFKQRQQHKAGKQILHLQDTSYLHKALQKYEDASFTDPNSMLYHMHAGRVLLMLGKIDEALLRLKQAVALKPMNSEARFYLGVAMASKGEVKNNEIMEQFLIEGLMKFLHEKICYNENETLVESFASVHNTVVMDGLHQLLNNHKQCFMSKSMLWQLLCLQSMTCLSKITNRNGRSFNKYQQDLIQTHYEYGLYMKNQDDRPINEMRQYWKQLSNLALVFCEKTSMEILNVQKKICEEVVTLLPRSSEALANLASILVSIQEISPNFVVSGDIELLFRASMEVEGMNIHEENLPSCLEKTKYWCQKNEATETKSEDPKKNDSPVKATKTVPAPKPVASKAPAANARKAATTTKTPVANSKSPATSSLKTTTTKKPVATTTKTSPMKASGVSKPLPAASRSKTNTKANSSKTKLSLTKAPVKSTPGSTENSKVTKVEQPIELNEKNATARLGLARILKHDSSKGAEVEQLYNEVIEMAPHTHDAYIELAEILSKTKPLDAVNVYCKFPFSAAGGFDDGYLYGEIVRLLMKEKQYEDERLKKFMIELGKVMGFTSLEKYITILENLFKYNKLLREVYAGVNNKSVEDEDVRAFFKFKCWE